MLGVEERRVRDMNLFPGLEGSALVNNLVNIESMPGITQPHAGWPHFYLSNSVVVVMWEV